MKVATFTGKESKMCFHRHKWEETNRSHLSKRLSFGNVLSVLPDEPVTLITQQCSKCKVYRQQTLSGWLGKISE